MGKADVAIKSWLKDSNRFADLFNGIIFGGRNVILSENLTEVNSESDVIIVGKNNKSRVVEKYRDIIMRWKDNLYLVLLAVEIQDRIHYGMPVRKMLYDALSYTDQMRNIWQNSSAVVYNKKVETDEFLSRFRKDDKLYPVITIVFYYGDEWDGNFDLYDMFGFDDDLLNKEDMKTLKKYISNYKITVFNPSLEKNLNIFKSDLQKVFEMIKYKGDKKGLIEYTTQNRDYFSCVDYETSQAIKALLGTGNLLKHTLNSKTKEGNDVCKALQDLYDDGITEGKKIGREEGREEGKILAFSEMGFSLEEIANRISKPLEYVEEVIGLQTI